MAEKKGRKRIGDRILRPHILTEILKSGMQLSANAQANYLDVLDRLSDTLRENMTHADLLKKVGIDHAGAWKAVKGKRIGFVDGGMANVAPTGAAPVAIRVGSYVVIPGMEGTGRENFDFQLQLVDELYEGAGAGHGIYEDLFEDTMKLRDAARITCEIAGVLSLTKAGNPPEIIFLHGPLVNPVSPYALGTPGTATAFPNFTQPTLRKLLPGERSDRSGRDANFVAVYRDQLKQIAGGRIVVCGVVERPSSAAPGPLTSMILAKLVEASVIDQSSSATFTERMTEFRITDSVIFECVLDEGEYISPLEVNKQGPDGKIPVTWFNEIRGYPNPLVTYVKSHNETMPVRVETFRYTAIDFHDLMKLVVHMSRLLPRYSFPVGLDIVDRHAKIPEWMSRQIDVMLGAQLMRKAMESGNINTIQMVRRILSTNTRDWLFRPDFRR